MSSLWFLTLVAFVREMANNRALGNEYNIALKVWLFPDQFGDKLADLQRRYPKPDLEIIDHFFINIMNELKKDARPIIKY